MTKKEIALTLARQFAELEKHSNSWYEQMKLARTNGDDEGEIQYCKRQWKEALTAVKTVEASYKMLGISEKTWFDAITAVYIENSKKENNGYILVP